MKTLQSQTDYSALLDAYDTWLFDCDGVLWHGDRLIDGALDVLALLRKHSPSSSHLSPYLNSSHLTQFLRKTHPLRHQQRHKVSPAIQSQVRLSRRDGLSRRDLRLRLRRRRLHLHRHASPLSPKGLRHRRSRPRRRTRL